MTKIKILFLSILVITAVLGANAQRLSVKTGLNLAKIFSRNNDRIISSDFEINPGLTLEAAVEFPINKTFFLETGLQLSTEGTKRSAREEYMGYMEKYDLDLDLYYANIPLRAKIYWTKDKVKIYGALGAYCGIGLYGNGEYKLSYKEESEAGNIKVEWGNDSYEDDFRRMDYGLTVGGGLEYDKFLLSVNYNLGLANITPYLNNGTKIQNRVFGISVGYIFQM